MCIDDINNMDLKNAIKFYAIIIADDDLKGRIEVHERICNLIGVDKNQFNPFECFGPGCRIHSAKHAEQLIRARITQIKKEQE